MSKPENLGSFIHETRSMLGEYLETRLEILRLQSIRSGSKAMGQFMWILVSLCLFFVVFIFASLVLAFWITDITGSFIKGFGFTTIILIVLVGVIALLRKQLFVDPTVKKMISHLHSNEEEDEAN